LLECLRCEQKRTTWVEAGKGARKYPDGDLIGRSSDTT
jgi:hypothetical protein